jgi:uncharacterized protein (TIGR03000 family)
MSLVRIAAVSLAAVLGLFVLTEREAAAQGCTAARGCPSVPPAFSISRSSGRSGTTDFNQEAPYRNVSRSRDAQAIDIVGAAPRRTVPSTGSIATIHVTVPAADAKVTFQGVPTQSQGESRVFTSPALAQGVSYRYVIRCQWTKDGREYSRQVEVPIRAGQESAADFTQPEA